MSTIFTRIVKGEIPCYKVAENDKHFAFLDINPLSIGHTLVIPKEERDYIFDIDDSSIAELMVFAKKVALAVEKVVSCKRVGVVVLGLEVPHAHIHLIPIENETDISFSKERLKLSENEFNTLAEEIRSKIE